MCQYKICYDWNKNLFFSFLNQIWFLFVFFATKYAPYTLLCSETVTPERLLPALTSPHHQTPTTWIFPDLDTYPWIFRNPDIYPFGSYHPDTYIHAHPPIHSSFFASSICYLNFVSLLPAAVFKALNKVNGEEWLKFNRYEPFALTEHLFMRVENLGLMKSTQCSNSAHFPFTLFYFSFDLALRHNSLILQTEGRKGFCQKEIILQMMAVYKTLLFSANLVDWKPVKVNFSISYHLRRFHGIRKRVGDSLSALLELLTENISPSKRLINVKKIFLFVFEEVLT